MKPILTTLVLLLSTSLLLPLVAQTCQDSITFRASVISNLLRRERVFLHFDNTGYYLGETMWFKAYVTESNKNLTDMSRVLYVELVAPEGYVVETKKYKLENGTCNGEFTLHPLLLSGYYEIRAYTRYMLNWGKDAAFSRVIPIYDKVNGDNYDFRNMLDRKRGFMYRGEWITSEAKDISPSFYPEGGNLVYGMESLVAYELKDENGRELQAIVSILEDGKEIINSTPQYMGKGTFKIKPGQGKKYTAEVIYGKKKKKFDFLDIHKEGARIAVKENGEKIEISVAHNMQDTQTVGCVIFANDKIIAYRQIEKNENILTFEKEKLPIGVNRAILFINDSIPLAERQFFVMKDEALLGEHTNVKLKTTIGGKSIEDTKLTSYEKVDLKVEREDGKPMKNNTQISISITDKNTRQITTYNDNIYTYMLLTSQIKGYIPETERLFDTKNPNRKEELDLVMLTQGWTSYDWKQMAQNGAFKIKQPIETGLMIKGLFVKKEKIKKLGKLGTYNIIPQAGQEITFEASYKDSTITKSDFNADRDGRFAIYTDDFKGKKYVSLTPRLSARQIEDSLFAFSLDRYFSPSFRLFDYWEYNSGTPGYKRDSSVVKLSPFEYMLSQVEVTAAPIKDNLRRPPRSEIRFNFLDEWEYAQDVTYLANVIDKDLDSRVESYDYEAENERFFNRKVEDIESLEDMKETGNAPLDINPTGVYDVNNRFWKYDDMLTAEDIVRSAFWRHNYNWAYWVQLMVVKGEYNSDSIPQPDAEHIKGKSPSKMMDFKEFVIRSDIKTRELFLNWSRDWDVKMEALKNKRTYGVYYWGFLKRLEIPTRGEKLIDEFPGIDIFYSRMKAGSAGPDFISHPRHPNYVACFIPYTPEEHATQIIPDLSLRTVKRHTMLQGYTESKQFYAPDYSKAKPDANKKDHRRTLLWNPNPEIREDGKIEISFFNNADAKEVVVDINGVDEGLIYSNSPTNKTDGEEEMELQPDTALTNMVGKMNKINPKELAHCVKITQYAQKLYNDAKFDEAFELFNEAAMKNYSHAQFSVAMCYMNGQGTKQDLHKAIYYLHLAADKGEPVAMHNIALCHLTGIAVAQSNEEAIEWYKKAAVAGYAPSQMALATIYYRGKIVEKNIEKALELYKLAAGQNEPGALLALGKYYENNEKPDPKDKKAVKQRNAMVIDYVTRAANKGIADAQWFLSQCYKEGRMVKKSNKAAFEWAYKAAEKGLVDAQCFIGLCYEKGRGIPENMYLAIKWYTLAARGGNIAAQEGLGRYGREW